MKSTLNKIKILNSYIFMEIKEFNSIIFSKDSYNHNIKNKIKKLKLLFMKEMLKGNKVAFYYEDINSNSIISFNSEMCFYAASTIKVLSVLMIFKMALDNKIDLNKKILVKMEDLKQDTGVIKYQKKDTYYTLKELLRLTIVESDNTAYLKLVDILGKEKIKKYGNSLGAKNTMVGRESDSFGLINCEDMAIYFKEIKKFIDEKNKYSDLFLEYLLNPSVKLIKDQSLNNKYVRKYGSYDLAYHECGYVLDDKPYYLFVLTQLNKKDSKEEFINEVAKQISDIHELIKEELYEK